jgi:glycosyltransferase involved in cell wall biosynthesis
LPTAFGYVACMLSVLIVTKNQEDALARTLAALVSGAVEGVVREVIVCDKGSTDRTATVAEHAGCHFLAQSGLEAGIRRARGEWLLLLEPGSRPLEGWIEAVVNHVADDTRPARFRQSHLSRPSFLKRLFSRSRPMAEGLLIERKQALALARENLSAEALVRSVAPHRIGADIHAALLPAVG